MAIHLNNSSANNNNPGRKILKNQAICLKKTSSTFFISNTSKLFIFKINWRTTVKLTASHPLHVHEDQNLMPMNKKMHQNFW